MAETSRIGLIANPEKPRVRELLDDLVKAFEECGICVEFETSAAKMAGAGVGFSTEELAGRSDLLVVLGGDGTLLWVLNQMGENIRPVAAINAGTLGFLTCATAGEAGELVEAISGDSFEVSPRSMMEAVLRIGDGPEKVVRGLNEVTLNRANESNTVHMETRVDGELVNHYSGDGLIIATPTGSTAYALSAGGPILEPGSGVFVITPICPHALANRSVVMGNERKIELLVPEQRGTLHLSVDGRAIAEIDSKARVEIRRSEAELPLIMLPGYSFYSVLHRKLGWSGSTVANSKQHTGKNG